MLYGKVFSLSSLKVMRGCKCVTLTRRLVPPQVMKEYISTECEFVTRMVPDEAPLIAAAIKDFAASGLHTRNPKPKTRNRASGADPPPYGS